jgi:hypothetical protein
MENLLLVITSEIFRQGKVPEILKSALLTPIFKNKGLKSQATNYRHICTPSDQQNNRNNHQRKDPKAGNGNTKQKTKRIYQWLVTNKFSPTSGGMLPRGRIQ